MARADLKADLKLPPSSALTGVRRGSLYFARETDHPGSAGDDTPRSGHRPPVPRMPSTGAVTQTKITASKNRLLHSDSDSDDDSLPMTRSQAFRRPPVPPKSKPSLQTLVSDDDADDDDSPGDYLPFATTSKSIGKDDPAATLRGAPRRPIPPQSSDAVATTSRPGTRDAPLRPATESSASSATSESTFLSRAPHARRLSNPSSASLAQARTASPTRRASDDSGAPRSAHPLSPRHRAQLASLSPRRQRDGSDGTPSMGSSFSDLDDASVTQSALEEALLSNVRNQGGSTMAGRMSSLRDVLGRRYG